MQGPNAGTPDGKATPDGRADPASPGTSGTIPLAGRKHAVVRRFRLRVLQGPDKGILCSSSAERMVVGTHETAGFVLTDRTLSRLHCEIALNAGTATVRDLGSRNGTRVDDVPVLEAPLRAGARLKLGQTVVRFELDEGHVTIPLHPQERFGLMVGRSRRTRAVFSVLERAAACDATVLLLGETGCGKDVAAESIHRESPRRDGPFVVVDCGALPSGVLESELFGHVRGSFTGAERTRIGAFEAAARGTLFLDEIGELPFDLQPKLLRALEKREVRRVGSTEPIATDARIVAATNRNLCALVNSGRFRSDLYFRIAVIEVTLPPLREHTEDLSLLVEELLAAMGATDHPAAGSLRSHEHLTAMAKRAWPGNVRELRNHLERSLVLGGSETPDSAAGGDGELEIDLSVAMRAGRERWVREFERRYLDALLKKHGNNVSAAARESGMARSHLHSLLARSRPAR